MGELPFVSFVIPYCNSERTIQYCLDSIFQIDYPSNKFDIFVIDNGSSGYSEKLANNSKINYFYTKQMGRAFARNFGVEKTHANFIAFVDSDVVIEKSWLKKMIAGFDKSSTIFASQSSIIPIALTEKSFLSRYIYWRFERITSGSFNTINRPWPSLPKLDTAALLVKRSLFLLLGGFDERLERFEDRDFGIKGLKYGYLIYLDSKVYVRKICDNKTIIEYIYSLIFDAKGEVFSILKYREINISKTIFFKIKFYVTFLRNKFVFNFYYLIEIFEYFISIVSFFYFVKKTKVNCRKKSPSFRNKIIRLNDFQVIEVHSGIMQCVSMDKFFLLRSRVGKVSIYKREFYDFWLEILNEEFYGEISEPNMVFLESLKKIGVNIINKKISNMI